MQSSGPIVFIVCLVVYHLYKRVNDMKLAPEVDQWYQLLSTILVLKKDLSMSISLLL